MCVCVCNAHACVSFRETEISELMMCVGVWEAVIWCMGVGVKADMMRIVIILVPSI